MWPWVFVAAARQGHPSDGGAVQAACGLQIHALLVARQGLSDGREGGAGGQRALGAGDPVREVAGVGEASLWREKSRS